ncbi:ABC transporter substrate-binding protein [Thermicanus aegyptius]|uniref:ABC transporter substrate-binding protein n=1 Tax=Thermicanus aegyptius TaxID=94009 RepID=UPI0003F8FA1F|nr:ABC transporter substrate-binding protein [Thermicanus aegyptius]
MKNMTKSIFTVVLSFLLLLTGCSSGEKTATNEGVSQEKTGGTLNISLDSDPPKLDPSLSTALVDRMVFQSIFDKMVDIDENGEIIPMLAKEWKISEDLRTYTFVLQQGVKFHDGTDFNAEAVKFNFERNMDQGSPRKNELKEVSKVSVVDPYTVQVELKRPFAPFLSILADRAGMMVSPAAVKKYGDDFSNHPVGTGPFVFKERVKGSFITLEKNTNYWKKGMPKLNQIVYKIITDANVALMNLKSGQVDMTNRFPFKEIEKSKNDPNFTVISEPGQGYQGIHLNVSKPPFDRKELRQAVDLLIDRDAIVNVLLSGAGTPAHSPFSPTSFAYGESDRYEKPDLQKARDLLKKAGKPNGFSFTLKIGTSPLNQQVGQMIQTMLKPAGIQVNLEKVEFGTLLDQTQKGNYEAAAIGWSGRPDPDQNIYDFYVTGGPQNYSFYSNAEVDRLLDEARAELDEAKRKTIYDQAMKIINEEVPYIYLYHDHNVFGISKSVDGFQYVPDGLIRTVGISKR